MYSERGDNEGGEGDGGRRINLKSIKMKTILFTFIFGFVFTFQLFAQQINNGDLENWQNYGNFEMPDFFYTYDQALFVGSPTTIKSTDAQSGQYAALLQTVQGPGPSDWTGGLGYGSYQTQGSISTTYGHPFTHRPSKLIFWYKYFNAASDTGLAGVLLSKWNGTTKIIIGEGLMNFTSNITSYTMAELAITYYSSLNPDTVIISFIGSWGTQTPGTMLYIDNLSFDYTTDISDNTFNIKNFEFQNPVTDKIQISTTSHQIGLAKLFDLTGKMVKEEFINSNKSEIDISELENGFYILRIGESKFKIVKQ